MMLIARTISTGFGSGLAPKASGTFGSLAAVAVWWLLLHSNETPGLCSLVLTVITLFAGVLATEKDLESPPLRPGKKGDPHHIVIDEWAGMFLSLAAASPGSFPQIGLAFLLFRFFDITKLWFAKKAEAIPGAWGVMLDDIVAGAYTLIAFIVIQKLSAAAGFIL